VSGTITPANRRAKLLIALLLALMTAGVYLPVGHFDFTNYDDTDYVTYNPMVQRGINRESLRWAFTSNHASNWHPLTWISHMADCDLYGLKPGGHHLTNLLFHVANAVLLFLVLEAMTGGLWRSALVAALFAWHPLHVESVAWVSERKDVLSTFFWLLTMGAYATYAKSEMQNVKCKVYYVLALLCFTLGLLSKPMVVTLPFVLLLLDFWPLRRITDLKNGPWIALLLEKIPFFALAAFDCVATVWAQKAANSVVATAALPISDRIANALVSYVLYLWKTVWPANLAVPYSYSRMWTLREAAGAGALLALVTMIVVCRRKTQPFLAVGWFWFLGTLVPVIGLVQVGIQFMADRYTYVPLIGIFIMVAWSIPASWATWPRPGLVLTTAICAILAILLMATSVQVSYWRNSITLFAHTTEVTRDNILAEYDLAEALARAGDDADAITHYQKALAIRPNPVEAQYNSQPQAHFNLGLIYRNHQQWADAEAQFRACLQDDPDLAIAHHALASVLHSEGRDAEASAEEQEAGRLKLNQAGQASHQ
jgi:protein O-mannosyl-transferase